MNLPISLLGMLLSPLFFVPPIYLLRRSKLGVWLAIVACLTAVYLLFQLPHAQSFRWLNNPLVLDDLWVYAAALLFIATACLCLLSLNISQGWSFYPLSLIILTLFTLAMANRHLGIIALIVEMAVLISIFIIQGGRLGSVRASLRFLVMMTLAVPIFLLAAHQMTLYRTNVGNLSFITQTALLMACGFGLWLGVVPLHGWLSAIALEAKPGIAAFIFITFPTVATIILLNLISDAPWLLDVSWMGQVIMTVGLFTAIVGGFLAAVQNAFGPLMGYSILFDVGCSLVALGLNTQLGLKIVLLSIFIRVIALILIAIAIAAIQQVASGDSFEQALGLARQLPIQTLGFLIGGFTLAGIPLTSGFVLQWLLLQALVETDTRWPAIILLGGLGVAIGYIRGGRALFQPTLSTPKATQNWVLNGLTIIFVILCLGIGIFPRLVLEKAQYLVQSIDLLGL